MDEQKLNKDYLLPASIIIAALLIAGAWVYSAGVKATPSPANETEGVSDRQTGPAALRPADAADHMLGNPEAPVKIVEYSDLECPYCKVFHETMKQIMREYGADGRVAWVYRHYPIAQLHSRAVNESYAAECAAELGGNGKFWEFIDKVFEITPSNDGLNPAELPKIAESIGLEKSKFESCLISGKFGEKINKSVEEAQGLTRGTPYSIISGKNGKQFPVEGAQPLTQVRILVEEALKE